MRSKTGCTAWTSGRTITWRSRSRSPSSWPACGPCCAGARQNAPRFSASATCPRVHLTPTEFALLECLMRRPHDALTRKALIEHVWDFAFEGDPQIVNVYICSLRDKIDRPFGRTSLQTVRGLGYRIRDELLDQAAD